MIPFLFAAAALTGRTWDPPRHREPAHTPDRRGCLPAPLPDDLPAYDGKHRTTPAPKGRRLTRAQRKALKAKVSP